MENVTSNPSKTIGKYTYSVCPLGVGDGLFLVAKVANMIAPALAAVPTDGLEGFRFGHALSAALGSRDLGNQWKYFLEVLAPMTQVSWTDPDGEKSKTLSDPGMTDRCFKGSYGQLFQFLYFGIEANVGSFLDIPEVQAMLSMAKSQGKSASGSQTPSTPVTPGQSGA